MEENNLPFSLNDSHITRIHIGNAPLCKQLADDLLKIQGVYLQPINFPTVPIGNECLRIIVTSRHEPKHINHLVYSLKKLIYGDDTHNREIFSTLSVADVENEA